MAAGERNKFIDVMRGLAMLLVVLGHTIDGCTAMAHDTILYNIVWSLQMPLFILISGYVTRYSRRVESVTVLVNYLRRRTVAYMLPWIVWSFLIRGCLFRQHSFLSIKWLLWHMDSGYWFLTTIWTISVVFGISIFCANRISRDPGVKQELLSLFFNACGMAFLLGMGFLFGFSFFAIKLTIYYMPFYYFGYLYGRFRDRILEKKHGKKTLEITVAVCLVVWLLTITRYNLFSVSESVSGTALRVISSLTGCIAICGLVKSLYTVSIQKTRSVGVTSFLVWIGEHSLEIYLSHYFLLCLLRLPEAPALESIKGAALTLANYTITVLLTVITVKALNGNRILRSLLFGNMGKDVISLVGNISK